MKNSDIPYFLGYVEQAIAGNQDPLSPSISVSRNGTLAKWRDKLNYIDLRVNDPGLKHPALFEQHLQKTAALGIKTIITLPEYMPVYFELPPAPPDQEDMSPAARRTAAKRPKKLTYFKPSYLALPAAIQNSSAYHALTVAECAPIIELAAKYEVKDVIVPVAEPGNYLDPLAEKKFRAALAELTAVAEKNGVTLHLRNGGISLAVFQKFAKEFKCKLAYDVGIGFLESDDFAGVMEKIGNHISIFFLQQVIRGLDKLTARRENIEKAMKEYVSVRREYLKAKEENEENYAENMLKNMCSALAAYFDACRCENCNIALYQSGDMNMIPILKQLKQILKDDSNKTVILSMVPNTKNNDLIAKYMVPENFSVSI